MDYQNNLRLIEQYVAVYAQQHGGEQLFPFHNHHHIQDVLHAVNEMADYYKLNDEDRFVLNAAAYFHDIGYFTGGAEQHEQRSADIAATFLATIAVPEPVISKISGCILATKIPQNPQNLLEQIMCDADLFHIGTDHFSSRNKLMHAEADLSSNKPIRKRDWREKTIRFLENHQYHTEYAKAHLEATKAKNLMELQAKAHKNEIASSSNHPTEMDLHKIKKPEKGIETMFRITSSNSQRLSDMADNKAHILLTVNSIILSMVVAVLLRKLDSNEHLIIPTILLMTCVVSTMVFAILATIPKIPKGVFKKDDVLNGKTNLLFFGNFYRMKLKDYEESMERVMDNANILYGMLIKDVYSQGVVLGRKYKLLRYAYGIFMIGLIVSVLGFMLALYFI